MNKTEMIAEVAEKTGQTAKTVGTVVDAVFESITNTVAAGGEAAFVGFGTFATVARSARAGRNPTTGEPIQIPASTAPKFTPGKVFKDKVKGKA